MRLNKFIAGATGLSRREADALIAHGRVSVNDQPARLGLRLRDDDVDVVRLDNQILHLPLQHTLIMMNKPRGYVSSRRAQAQHAHTLYELLPDQYVRLKTIGRLDRDSSGLILLTDDGDLAFRLTHPKFAKSKTYLVRLDKGLTPDHQRLIAERGVELPDGPSRLQLVLIDQRSDLSDHDFSALKTAQKVDFGAREIWRVQMSEGRNRQIRRTFSALGYNVERLHRIEFGEYMLGDLEFGEIRAIKSISADNEK